MVKEKSRLGIVIVAYGHEAAIGTLLQTLRRQMNEDDRIVVVDNHHDHLSARAAVNSEVAVDKVIEAENHGFSAGCNLGAAVLMDQVEVLVFINPDTYPSKNLLNVMRSGADTSYSAWMALVTLPDGSVNSCQTVVHISGLSWAGGYGTNVADYKQNQSIAAVSGACMAVRTTVWQEMGGMEDKYFMYYEDTDFSARLFLSGHKLGLLPKGTIAHDYEFEKGRYKWLYIERNRYLYMLRVWPLSVLLVLAPVVIVCDLGLIFISVSQKRFRLKVLAIWQALSMLPWALRTRHSIQRTRAISGYEYLQSLEPRLTTPLLGALSSSTFVNGSLFAYYRFASGLLRFFRL